MLEFSVLASGSSGNALYIQSPTTHILLDAGISGKQLQQRLLQTSGKSLSDLDALLVTHEHIDHVRGLRQVIKQSQARIYSTEGTWSQVAASVEKDLAATRGTTKTTAQADPGAGMDSTLHATLPTTLPTNQHATLHATKLTGQTGPGALVKESRTSQTAAGERGQSAAIQIVKAGQRFVIGDISVTPFTVSHDAEEPVAYRFDSGESSLTVATDLGYVSDAIKDVIADCQCYVFESNHDVGMLRAGRYPWNVKRRILGDKGHLSNYDAALALADLLGTREVEVYLAHLSEENNQPDLAELTVSSVLRELRESYIEQVRLRRTGRHEATPLHKLG